jgi:hypothetical protein
VVIVELLAGSESISLAAIYRPPGSCNIFLTELDLLLCELNHKMNAIIMGDLNIHFENTNSADAVSLSDMLNQFHWQQHVQGPTHEGGHTLDLIMSKIDASVPIIAKSIRIESGLADHSAITFTLNCTKPKPPTIQLSSRKLSKVNIDLFWTDFWLQYETAESSTNEIEQLVQVYNDCGKYALDRHAPVKRVQVKYRKHIIMFSPMLYAAKKKVKELGRKSRLTKLTVDIDLYKIERNCYIAMIRKEKDRLLRRKLNEPEISPKQLWATLSQVTGSSLKAARKRVNKINLKPQECQLRANELAKFFSDKIAAINLELRPFRSKSLTSLTMGATIMFEFEHVMPNEIRGYLKNLSSNKTSPADAVPTAFLKVNTRICHHLSLICNASFESATFPGSLKHSIISPVLKRVGLDADDFKNFRPISLIQTIAKVIERAAAQRLMDHLEKVGFLHKFQSAYRPLHSTETATLHVLSKWRSAIDAGRLVCVASLDVTAAFDTVDHEILCCRLVQAGVMGRALNWIRSYLTDRTATVKIDEALSNEFKFTSGVPQGSVLGPCLFNCYMAELCRVIETCERVQFHVYADDVLVFVECEKDTIAEALQHLQETLEKIEDWMKTNSLLLNAAKTELVLLHREMKNLHLPSRFLKINGQDLEIRTYGDLKWLGVCFDVRLEMTSFVNNTCRTCFGILRMLRQIRQSIDKKSTNLLANALVLSRADYCVSLLQSVNVTLINKLQRVINLAARIIEKKRRFEHISPTLCELGWLPVKLRLQKKVAILVYKSLHSLAPEYLSDGITRYLPKRSLRSSHSIDVQLVLGQARSKIGRGAWNVFAPIIWNALPNDIRDEGIKFSAFLGLLDSYLNSLIPP